MVIHKKYTDKKTYVGTKYILCAAYFTQKSQSLSVIVTNVTKFLWYGYRI
jgi:hypothetical protein